MRGARIFVAFAYVILGASFLASTGLLINEFQELDWQAMVMAHSHLFLFFPLFGLLCLIAFYLPSVVFTHLYWNHLPLGRLRFSIGLIVVAALSVGVTKWLDAKPRAIWEVTPAALGADRGEPPGCGAGTCQRTALLTALGNLRKVGQERLGLSKFARNCATDNLLEPPEDMDKVRYCFAADAHLKGDACCAAQQRLANVVAGLQSNPATQSLSARYDLLVFLPLKTFFILIIIAIGFLLAVWHRRIHLHYRELIPRIERGIIIGALAMLLWLAMDYGYQQTTNVLFGRLGSGPQLRLSLVVAPWVLLLLFYFLTRLGKQGEMIGQISGVIVAAVAILRFQDLNDWADKLVGIGTGHVGVIVLFAIALFGFLALLLPRRWNPTDSSTSSS
jgi:hypothetical protein